jgi:hypothetical protein
MATEDRRSPQIVVRLWLDAVNQRDVERVLELSDTHIEIAGPRGTGHGHALLLDWLNHARISLESLRTFSKGDSVVATQHGIWRSPETGAVIGEAEVASHFRVADGRVIRYARYDSLDVALEQARLTCSDEVRQDV